MRRFLPGLVLALALAIALGSLLVAPQASAPAFPVRTSAVNFSLNYSDPASDVFQLWTSNDSHVTDASGFWILSPSPGTVNLIRLSSSDGGSSVNVFLKVQTTITISANTTYEMRLYTTADNSTHYVITYRDGIATMVANHTVSTIVNRTADASVGPLGWLEFHVSKSDLGNITAWDIDATAKQVAGNYTYEDFGWSLPGNPGSAPAFLQGRVTDAANGAGLANVNVSAGTGGYFTTTNATGYYSLPAAPGTLNITYTLSGYDTLTKQVTVQYQQTQTVNAQLSKTSTLPSYLPWILVVVLIVAVVLVAVLLMRRRKP